MAQRQDHTEDARFRVLRLLAENPEISQRDLASAVGVSLGRLHFLLRALVDKGFVKLGNFQASEDKRRYAYLLTARGLQEKHRMAAGFLARKTREYEALRAEIEAVRADGDISPGHKA